MAKIILDWLAFFDIRDYVTGKILQPYRELTATRERVILTFKKDHTLSQNGTVIAKIDVTGNVFLKGDSPPGGVFNFKLETENEVREKAFSLKVYTRFYGGNLFCWRCGYCGKVVRRLYFYQASNGDFILCRHCLRGNYVSQAEHRASCEYVDRSRSLYRRAEWYRARNWSRRANKIERRGYKMERIGDGLWYSWLNRKFGLGI